jgi:hypothetical protein
MRVERLIVLAFAVVTTACAGLPPEESTDVVCLDWPDCHDGVCTTKHVCLPPSVHYEPTAPVKAPEAPKAAPTPAPAGDTSTADSGAPLPIPADDAGTPVPVPPKEPADAGACDAGAELACVCGSADVAMACPACSGNYCGGGTPDVACESCLGLVLNAGGACVGTVCR